MKTRYEKLTQVLRRRQGVTIRRFATVMHGWDFDQKTRDVSRARGRAGYVAAVREAK